MKTSKLDCLVAGEANIDLMIQSTDVLEPGKEKLAQNFGLALGGSSAITAFNLASFRTKVAFVGVVGTDVLGRFVRERLMAGGVDVRFLRQSEREKTGITVWFDRSGERGGMTYLGTIPLLRPGDIPFGQLNGARHLHVGHYFLLQKFHAKAPAVFAKAKRLGLTTSLDCNYDPSEKWDSNIRKVLPHVDVFFPNEHEAMRLTGCTSAEDAARELGKLAKTIAVKLGERGVLMFTEGVLFRIPAAKVRAVDTTGAGDSFNAGFLARFLRGASVSECAKSGVEAAARCVRKVGGTAAFEKRS
ncbi:MAG TPA: carbohydrate kinase family protein [Bryobacteraceae bacterium]|jgi:sugar/nucleoside kinase (ribokinase family)